MLKNLFLTVFALALPAFACSALENHDRPRRYIDARELRLINRGFPGQCVNPYARVPEYLADSVRPSL